MSTPTRPPERPIQNAVQRDDGFDEEVTIPVAPPVPAPAARRAIPRPVFDDEVTRPVDVATMDRAAKQSKFACDEGANGRAGSPHTIVSTDTPYPMARLSIAGVRGAIEMRVRNASATGLVLEMDEGQAPGLTEGIAVSVQLRWQNRTSPALAQLRLAGTVAHRRDATASVRGGMSVRWNETIPGTNAQISELMEALNTPHE